MNKPCPDCGHPAELYADECPKCACWLDAESAMYLALAFFIIYVLALGVVWYSLSSG